MDSPKDEELQIKKLQGPHYDTFELKYESPLRSFDQPSFRNQYRFVVLILTCLLLFGGYFCMDQPNAVSKYIEESMTGDSSIKYNMLYSFYSYPNIILPFFGGIFIDKLGLKAALNSLFVLCILGQSLFVIGGYTGSTTGFTFAIIGRTLFGMGNESMAIIQSVFANRWFKGKELAFALAMSMSVGRLGSTSNNLLMPLIAEAGGLGTALLFGLALIFMSYCLGITLLYLEKKAQQTEPLQEDPEASEDID